MTVVAEEPTTKPSVAEAQASTDDEADEEDDTDAVAGVTEAAAPATQPSNAVTVTELPADDATSK